MSAVAIDIRKKALGRGLDALFADAEAALGKGATPETSADVAVAKTLLQGAERRSLPVANIAPGSAQPRRLFADDALDSLAASIKEHGVIQPLLVRLAPGQTDHYELIAGERRWRAAQRAQLHEVPVIIMDLPDNTAQELALIENIQRQDLSAMEEAYAYKRLIDEHGYGLEELAQKLGKSRPYLSNMLRLINLPPKVQDLIIEGQISAGQARPLIGHPNAELIAQQIIEMGLSARAVEKLALRLKGISDPFNETEIKARIAYHDAEAQKGKYLHSQERDAIRHNKAERSAEAKDPDIQALEDEMSGLLGLRVVLKGHDATGKHPGYLSIEYRSLDQLDDLLRRLTMAAQA